MKQPWPKLSEQLPQRWGQLFALAWGMCQSCGKEGGVASVDEDGLEVWREHDHADKGTPVAVVLCSTCAKALIGPHPRLYSKQRRHVPLPGVMELCIGCPFRDGYRCTHGDLTTNGRPTSCSGHPVGGESAT